MIAEKYNPYRRYNDHKALPVLSKTIKDLVARGLIVETTAHEFIVGLLLRHLRLEGLIDQKIRPEYQDKVPIHMIVFDEDGMKVAVQAQDGTLLWEREQEGLLLDQQLFQDDVVVSEHSKNHPAWRVIEVTINDLVERNDLIETVARECILDYIIEQLDQSGLLINPPLDLPIKCCTK